MASEDTRPPTLWERLMRWGGISDEQAEPALPDEAISRHERVLIQNVLRLRDLAAWDVMVPRVDIVAVDAAATFEDIVAVFIREGHSRLPVYRENLDHIMGMIHVKDLLGAVVAGAHPQAETLVRQVLFVAPTTLVTDLLTQMRDQRVRGRCSGLCSGQPGLGFVGPPGHGNNQRLERFDVVRKGRNGGFHGRNESASGPRCNRKIPLRTRKCAPIQRSPVATNTAGCASRSRRAGRPAASWSVIPRRP